jgi:hypothetical protein
MIAKKRDKLDVLVLAEESGRLLRRAAELLGRAHVKKDCQCHECILKRNIINFFAA